MTGLALAVTITAYSLTGPGAMGHEVRPGLTCAVSQDLAPKFLGKEIHIEGRGWVFVNDTMPRQWKKRVDLCVGSKAEAQAHGRIKGTITRAH